MSVWYTFPGLFPVGGWAKCLGRWFLLASFVLHRGPFRRCVCACPLVLSPVPVEARRCPGAVDWKGGAAVRAGAGTPSWARLLGLSGLRFAFPLCNMCDCKYYSRVAARDDPVNDWGNMRITVCAAIVKYVCQ